VVIQSSFDIATQRAAILIHHLYNEAAAMVYEEAIELLSGLHVLVKRHPKLQPEAKAIGTIVTAHAVMKSLQQKTAVL
jgi:hypothetical protein